MYKHSPPIHVKVLEWGKGPPIIKTSCSRAN